MFRSHKGEIVELEVCYKMKKAIITNKYVDLPVSEITLRVV